MLSPSLTVYSHLSQQYSCFKALTRYLALLHLLAGFVWLVLSVYCAFLTSCLAK